MTASNATEGTASQNIAACIGSANERLAELTLSEADNGVVLVCFLCLYVSFFSPRYIIDEKLQKLYAMSLLRHGWLTNLKKHIVCAQQSAMLIQINV